MAQTQVKRTVVTVEDRRAVLTIARVRKPAEIMKMGTEQFIRRELKARLGIPKDEPANDSVKSAVAHLMGTIKQLEDAARAARAAKMKAEQVEQAKAERNAKLAELVE